jgi:hypothetical protein
MRADFEPRALADASHPDAEDVTPVGFERRCRIMPGGDQLAAHCEQRRAAAGCREARRDAGVAADEFGADGDFAALSLSA